MRRAVVVARREREACAGVGTGASWRWSGDAVALGGRDLREQRVERGRLHEGIVREIVQEERDRSRRRATSRRASRARRRAVCDGASYAISASAASTRCSRRAGGPGLSMSCSRPLSVATAGAAIRAAVRQHERLRRGERFGDRRERRVADDEAADQHLGEAARRSPSSTGSTNAVRGSGIWPVASLDRVRARDVLLGQMRAEALGFDGRAGDRHVRLGQELGRRAGWRRARTRRKPGVERGVGLAPRRAQTASVSGPMPRVSGKLPARASSVAMWSSRPPGRIAASVDVSTPPSASSNGPALELPDPRDAQRLRRAAPAPVDHDHPRDERAVRSTFVSTSADLDGVHARAVDADAARDAPSRSARTRPGSRGAASSWSDENGNVSDACVCPGATRRSPRVSKSVREVTERWIVSSHRRRRAARRARARRGAVRAPRRPASGSTAAARPGSARAAACRGAGGRSGRGRRRVPRAAMSGSRRGRCGRRRVVAVVEVPVGAGRGGRVPGRDGGGRPRRGGRVGRGAGGRRGRHGRGRRGAAASQAAPTSAATNGASTPRRVGPARARSHRLVPSTHSPTGRRRKPTLLVELERALVVDLGVDEGAPRAARRASSAGRR